MLFLQLVSKILSVPAQYLGDLLHSLSVLEFSTKNILYICVSFISFCIFFTRCTKYIFFKPRPADCGKAGLKFKIPIGVFCLKLG